MSNNLMENLQDEISNLKKGLSIERVNGGPKDLMISMQRDIIGKQGQLIKLMTFEGKL